METHHPSQQENFSLKDMCAAFQIGCFHFILGVSLPPCLHPSWVPILLSVLFFYGEKLSEVSTYRLSSASSLCHRALSYPVPGQPHFCVMTSCLLVGRFCFCTSVTSQFPLHFQPFYMQMSLGLTLCRWEIEKEKFEVREL